MDAFEIIKFISESEKKTPVKVYVKTRTGAKIDFPEAKSFGVGDMIVIGDWADIGPILSERASDIKDAYVENAARNSAIPLLDLKGIGARIEPGAIIRDGVEIGDGAIVMMGAVINIGAIVGDGSMIDMGAILGGRATVGRRCHVGAGAVLAGVIEPPSADPVILGDDVLVGANAVVLEGVRVGAGAVVAAGAVVVDDVPEGAVVAGVPARVIKSASETDKSKISIVDALRRL
jgi:2,3,4,5-tetrahydropyridine-2-carboxylate N-succinyltransferase/tetrahydrodipicolinate N-acetyltransferase